MHWRIVEWAQGATPAALGCDTIGALAPAKTIAVGDVLDGKYEITGVLGRGAMGVVYQAVHKRLQRNVALKTLRSDISENTELVARFETEARAASAIGHANIVQVFDAGGDPMPYLVMELLSGESLGERLERVGKLGVDEAVNLTLQCLEGLSAAHGGGIVHRDLKPDNLFIAGGEGSESLIKILDFGISKILDSAASGDGRATQAGLVMGTPLYMSPEQARGRLDIDHRSDLWSMGCVLYECLVGTPPFAGDNHNQIMASVLDGSFVPLSTALPGVPDSLGTIVDRALNSDISKRFSSAIEFSEALHAFQTAPAAAAPVELAAFDNIADRFLAQEAEDEAQSAAPVVQARARAAAAPGNRFAPPDASSQVPLALDLDTPVQRRVTEDIPLATPRTARHKSQWVTRDEPSRFWASAFKFVLLVAVIAGGGAAYRYYTLGYILPRAEAAAARLEMQVTPADTTFLLDNAKQEQRSLSLASGKEFGIALLADGYLLRRVRVTPEPGQELTLTVQMTHSMHAIPVGVPGAPAKRPDSAPTLPAATIASGYEKLAALVECGTRLSTALQGALPASDEGDPTPVAYNLTDECRLVVEISTAKDPAIEPIDSASTALVSSVVALNQALRDTQSSSAASGKVQREIRAEVRKSSAVARKARQRWLQAMNTSQSRWLQEDALRIHERDGGGFDSVLRDLITSSDTWTRAHLATSKPAKELHRDLLSAHARASEAAKANAELYKRSGGALVLRALSPLLNPPKDGDILQLHNQAVGHYNKLILPISLGAATSKAAANEAAADNAAPSNAAP